MGANEMPTSAKRVTRELSARVVTCLAEVLPSDVWDVSAWTAMGSEGVMAGRRDTPGANWYFDNTYGGDDGYTDYWRVYYTDQTNACIDDHDLDGKPDVDDDPVDVAKFIAGVLAAGVPR